MKKLILILILFSGTMFAPNPKTNRILRTPYKNNSILTPFGNIVSEDYTVVNNLSNYTTVNPQSTWAVVSNSLHTTCTAVGGFANYARFDGYGSSVLDCWKQTINFKAVLTDPTSIGISIGCVNTNAMASDVYTCFCATYAGGVGLLSIHHNGTAVVNNSNVIVGQLSTDQLSLSLELTNTGSEPTYVATLINSTRSQTRTATYSAITMTSTTILTNTTFKWGIYNNGGTFDISILNVSSLANKNTKIGFIGYSIDYGFNSGGLTNAYTYMAMSGNSRSFQKYTSQSAYSQSFLNCSNELSLSHCNVYIIGGIMGNDKRFNVTDVTAIANVNTLIKNLKSTSPKCKIYFCYQTPASGNNMNLVNANILNIAGGKVIDLFTPLLGTGFAMNAAYDTDGTHPNQAGHAVIGSILAPYLRKK